MMGTSLHAIFRVCPRDRDRDGQTVIELCQYTLLLITIKDRFNIAWYAMEPLYTLRRP